MREEDTAGNKEIGTENNFIYISLLQSVHYVVDQKRKKGKFGVQGREKK